MCRIGGAQAPARAVSGSFAGNAPGLEHLSDVRSTFGKGPNVAREARALLTDEHLVFVRFLIKSVGIRSNSIVDPKRSSCFFLRHRLCVRANHAGISAG